MGPAGAGKSTVGRALAQSLGGSFIDADDLHAAVSVEKMRQGIPLTDEDRWPWLRQVKAAVERRAASREPVVLACSALRQEYRDYLRTGLEDVRIVFLNGTSALLQSRLDRRTGHFAGKELLKSQLDALEPPADALTLDAALPSERLVALIVATLT